MKMPMSFSRTLCTARVAARAVLTMSGVWLTTTAMPQSIVNGAFASGTLGWTGCGVEVNFCGFYGGPNFTDRVSSVHSGLNPFSSADDRLLCQSISGFLVGGVYVLDFQATRPQVLFTPATVTSIISIDGGALDVSVTRTGGWNMAPAQFLFTATQTTHALRITAGQSGALGMLLDNLSISLVSELPMELLFFDAQLETGRVRLDWATATELQNDHFTVERSTDAISFEPLVDLPAAGTSQNIVAYSAWDEHPYMGTTYYRLKQTDTDGDYSYSATVFVDPSTAEVNVVSVGPGQLRIDGDASGRSLHLWSMTGQLLYTAEVLSTEMLHPHLSPGSYIVTLTDPTSGAVHTDRLFQY
jgi:hypothetical protein